MDINKSLMQGRADLDQSWSELGDLFTRDIKHMVRLWALLSDPDDLEVVRALPDEDLQIVAILAMAAMKELLQQTGDKMTAE